MLAPSSSKLPCDREDLGRGLRSTVPSQIWTTFWRMNETPIAVISGASRGAFRSGR